MKTRHILLTNDFPPKRGGIQNYHYELWRRLDPDTFSVVCPYGPNKDQDKKFDDKLPFKVTRVRGPLLPTNSLLRVVEREIEDLDASFVVIEPAFLLGRLGKFLSLPYVVVVFGAEFVVPARVPILRKELARTLEGATTVIAGGEYPALEVTKFMDALGKPVKEKISVIRPGVDHSYFRPPGRDERVESKEYFGILPDQKVVVFVSRLVPRKGADTVIKAVSMIDVKVRPRVLLGGTGREEKRLRRLAEDLAVDATFLGGLSKGELRKLYWSGDVFAMAARSRWMGLEQEGFGIVFLEGAASGLPVVAGKSGGSFETLLPGITGFLIDPPNSPVLVKKAIESILEDPKLQIALASAGRDFVVERFDYDVLVGELKKALQSVVIS